MVENNLYEDMKLYGKLYMNQSFKSWVMDEQEKQAHIAYEAFKAGFLEGYPDGECISFEDFCHDQQGEGE